MTTLLRHHDSEAMFIGLEIPGFHLPWLSLISLPTTHPLHRLGLGVLYRDDRNCQE